VNTANATSSVEAETGAGTMPSNAAATRWAHVASITARDLLDRDFPPRRNLLDPWLPEAGLAMLYAARGIGKTHVSTAAPDPRPRGKNVGTPCCWPGEVIAARVRHRRAGAGPSLASLPGSGAVGVIQQ
jgi:AAA domain